VVDEGEVDDHVVRDKSGFHATLSDTALAELRRQLSSKSSSSWHGSSLWVAQRRYPSSKLCSRFRTRRDDLPRSARVFHRDTCGLVIDRDLNAAKSLAALADLACACLMAQLLTGQPVDWSYLPVRPSGWEPDRTTRSSRGRARARCARARCARARCARARCARAKGRTADGGEGKTAGLEVSEIFADSSGNGTQR